MFASLATITDPVHGVHISMDADSPFYDQHRCRLAQPTLNGERVPHCVEASEPDGFVIQLATRDTAWMLNDRAIEQLPPAHAGSTPRVKRYGIVSITFRSA